METTDEKKTITIKQGAGNDAMEMTMKVTKEELEQMERICNLNPENWEGEGLELLQEARNRIKHGLDDKQAQIKDSTIETNDEKNGKRLSKGAKWTFVIFGLLLFSYKSYVSYLQNEVDRFVSEISGYDVTRDYSFMRESGRFADLFDGIGAADYYVLVPFDRFSNANTILSLEKDIKRGASLKDSQEILLEAIKLNAETEFMYGGFITEWYSLGLCMPIVIEVLFWLIIAVIVVIKF